MESNEIRRLYDRIIQTLKRFVEVNPRYYPIIALWVVGTYFHKDFYTYPYLFFNATRGSATVQ